MQHIKTFFLRKYNFLDDIIKIYEHFSDVYNDNSLIKNDISYNFKEFVDFIYDNGFKNKYDYFNYTNENEKISNNIKKEKLLLFFSGGKDSVYCALKLKEKYDVTLYFVKGINKSYPNEIERAKECAKILDLPLVIENISLIGKTIFLENPIKNMFIYACGLNFGIDKGFGLFCLGNHKNDVVSNSNFDRNFSDTYETILLFEKCINKFLEKPIKSLCLIENYYDSVIYLGKYLEFYDVIQSCITPHRFRNKLKEINEKKYKINLSKYDCGSCWKCCVKYVIYMDLGYIEYNKEFYKHCLKILKAKEKTDLSDFNFIEKKEELYELFTNGNKFFE